VLDEVFIGVTSVPLKAGETAKNIFHGMLSYMTGIYMSRFFCGMEKGILYAQRCGQPARRLRRVRAEPLVRFCIGSQP
jgi:hypothetical protein